jgi:hypothetical protein
MAVVAVLFCLTFGNQIQRTPFHGDESQWMATSLAWEALWQRSYEAPRWFVTSENEYVPRFPEWIERALVPLDKPAPSAWNTSYWTLTQPPVARYVIAIGRHLGGYPATELNRPYVFEKDEAENIRLGTLPAKGLLVAARAPMAVLAVLCGIIVFWIVGKWVGSVAAYAFAMLFAFSEYFHNQLLRAMGESTLLSITVASLAAGIYAMAQWQRNLQEGAFDLRLTRWWRPLLGLFVMALLGGLAGATKLNGILIAGAVVMLGVVMAASRGFDRVGARIGFALGAGLLSVVGALGAFVLVNPFLYPAPFARTAAMLYLRSGEIASTQKVAEWAISGLGERFTIVPYRVFDDFIFPSGTFGDTMLLHIFVIGSIGTLCLWGLIRLGVGAVRHLKGLEANPAHLVLLCLYIVTALPGLCTPLDWERYYLHAVFFNLIFISMALQHIIRLVSPRVCELFRSRVGAEP